MDPFLPALLPHLVNGGAAVMVVAIYARFIHPEILRAFREEMEKLRVQHAGHIKSILRRLIRIEGKLGIQEKEVDDGEV